MKHFIRDYLLNLCRPPTAGRSVFPKIIFIDSPLFHSQNLFPSVSKTIIIFAETIKKEL